MRRFYVPFSEKPTERFSFDREETRHIQRVLRLSEGDEINVFDGNGNEFRCAIEAFEKKITHAKILKQVEPEAPESPLNLILGVTLTKGDKFDLVIQKSVELGVSSIIPLITIRADVKAKNVEGKLERWRKIIIESSKQCGRATLMDISDPCDFEDFVMIAEGSKIMFSERDGNSFSGIKPSNKITALIGPKGGWDDAELEFAGKNDFQIVTFGGRILRAETAAISIASILQNQFGDIN